MNRIDIVGAPIGAVLRDAERALRKAEGRDATAGVRNALLETLGVARMAAGEALAHDIAVLADEMERTPGEESDGRVAVWIGTLERLRRSLETVASQQSSTPRDIDAIVLRTSAALSADAVAGRAPDPERLRAARTQYERALLQALKASSGDSGLAEMGEALGELETQFSGTSEAGFWSIMAAALDCIRASSVGFDPDARRFCAALNLGLRRAIDGASPNDPALTYAALELIARGNASGARVRKVRAAAVAAGLPDPELDPAVRDQCLAHIAAASDALERLVAGDVEARAAVEAGISRLEAVCASAGARGIADFSAEMAHALRAPHPRTNPVADRTAVALALLLVDRAVRVSGAADAPLRQVMSAMGQSLHAIGDGEAEVPIPPGATARATGFDCSSVMAAGQVMRSGLAAAEAALECYFESPGDAAPLASLEVVLAEIAGMFAVLGARCAEQTVRTCAASIARLAETDSAERDAFERIAEQVAALAAFVDGLVRDGNARENDHPFCFSAAAQVDAALQDGGTDVRDCEAAPLKAQENPPEWIERPSDPELAAIFIEEAREVLAVLETALVAGASAFEDRERAVEVRRGFHTLKGSGRMVGLERFAQAAWCVEDALNAWLEHGRGLPSDLVRLACEARARSLGWIEALERNGEASIDIARLESWAQCIKQGETLPEDTGARGRDPQAVREIAAVRADSLASLSANLHAIFADESARHVTALRGELELCRDIPGRAVTHEFMLAAHTLASACATMRLQAPSTLGGALEDLLVELLRGEFPPLPGQIDLVEKAVDALEHLVAEGIGRRPTCAEPALLEALGEARRAVEARAAALQSESPHPLGANRGPYHWAAGSRRRFRPQDELDPQLLPVFLEEAQELVPRIGAGLRRWRADPAAGAFAHDLLRELHTLKGSARMAGAMGIGELAHAMETRVERAAARQAATPEWFDLIETNLDRLSVLVDEVADRRQSRGAGGGEPPKTPAAGSDELTRPLPGETTGPVQVKETDGVVRSALRIRADALDRIVNQSGEVGIARARAEAEVRALKTYMRELADNVIRLRGQLRDLEIHAESRLQSTTTMGIGAEQSFDPLELDRYTRFQELTRMMAESLSDVTVVQQSIHKNVDEVSAALSAQAVLSRDLQQELMRVRMVPFSSIAERLHRVVRQSAKELGKRANLDIHGLHAEVDRVVLERITAPLEHMLRNAVTHGLEHPEARAAAGKAAIGTVSIEVRQENNEIVIMHRDDGAGIEPARIRAKAIAGGHFSETREPSEAEILELIFQPGFSTATRVTQLAGRGVGLDVVRSEVKALGGRVAVSSVVGKGTTFTLHLPLTLSVTRALLVKAGVQTFALPAGMVEEVLLLGHAEMAAFNESGTVACRGSHLALRYLPRLLGAPTATPEARKRYPVLVLKAGTEAMAVLVDSVVGSRDIVLKNLGPQLTRLSGLIGASILPGGDIALLLNPFQLRNTSAAARETLSTTAPLEASHELVSVMVVDDSITVRRVTHRLLSRQGYEVVTARDGVEALERLRESRPAVMLVDIEMPRMDGFELTRLVRSSSTLHDIPIIMITSRAADKHREVAHEIGVNVFLGKPYSEQELLQHVQAFTRKAA